MDDLMDKWREFDSRIHGKFVFQGNWDVELEKSLVKAIRYGMDVYFPMSIDAPENDTAYFSASGIGSFEFDYAEAFDEIAGFFDPDAFEALSQAMINHDLWFTCDFYSAQDKEKRLEHKTYEYHAVRNADISSIADFNSMKSKDKYSWNPKLSSRESRPWTAEDLREYGYEKLADSLENGNESLSGDVHFHDRLMKSMDCLPITDAITTADVIDFLKSHFSTCPAALIPTLSDLQIESYLIIGGSTYPTYISAKNLGDAFLKQPCSWNSDDDDNCALMPQIQLRLVEKRYFKWVDEDGVEWESTTPKIVYDGELRRFCGTLMIDGENSGPRIAKDLKEDGAVIIVMGPQYADDVNCTGWCWPDGGAPVWIGARQNEVLLCKTADYISDNGEFNYVIWLAVCTQAEYQKLRGDADR